MARRGSDAKIAARMSVMVSKIATSSGNSGVTESARAPIAEQITARTSAVIGASGQAADMPFLIDAVLNPGKDPIRVAGLRLRRWHLMARTLVPPPLLCASHEHNESTGLTGVLTPSQKGL